MTSVGPRQLVLGLVLLCVGCERKLPGPEECQRLAARILGVDDARMLQDPNVKRSFDNVTENCLVTPFDAQLVRCLDESRDTRRCFDRFEARRTGARQSETQSPVRRW